MAFESGSRRAAFPFTTRWGLERGRFTRTRRGDCGDCGLRFVSHGVHVSRGDADGESAEGDDEDGEAEEEPDVDAPEGALLVLGRLTLVVLLGLLDSALALALQRAAHREMTRRRCGGAEPGDGTRCPRGRGNRRRGNATRARLRDGRSRARRRKRARVRHPRGRHDHRARRSGANAWCDDELAKGPSGASTTD